MHDWSGNFKYFNDVSDAADEIGQFCRRWGRMQVTQTKEKYGTVRVYCSLGYYSLHSFIYPGYVYNQFPDWLWKLDINVFSRMLSFKPFVQLMSTYQIWIYNLAYKRAVRKYPHIREEILVCADWLELMPWAKDVEDKHWIKSGEK